MTPAILRTRRAAPRSVASPVRKTPVRRAAAAAQRQSAQSPKHSPGGFLWSRRAGPKYGAASCSVPEQDGCLNAITCSTAAGPSAATAAGAANDTPANDTTAVRPDSPGAAAARSSGRKRLDTPATGRHPSIAGPSWLSAAAGSDVACGVGAAPAAISDNSSEEVSDSDEEAAALDEDLLQQIAGVFR